MTHMVRGTAYDENEDRDHPVVFDCRRVEAIWPDGKRKTSIRLYSGKEFVLRENFEQLVFQLWPPVEDTASANDVEV